MVIYIPTAPIRHIFSKWSHEFESNPDFPKYTEDNEKEVYEILCGALAGNKVNQDSVFTLIGYAAAIANLNIRKDLTEEAKQLIKALKQWFDMHYEIKESEGRGKFMVEKQLVN